MKMILSLLLVLMICGCVLPNLVPGGGTKPKVKELPSDVVVIQSVKTLPSPPINPGDQFSISFQVANQEEARDVQEVGYAILDSGLCVYRGASRNPSVGTFTAGTQVFVPMQTEFVEWSFDAPKAEELAYISATCPIRFKVNYTFQAISNMEVDVISAEKYNQLQESGEFSTFTPTLTKGRGPLKIDMEVGVAQPVKNSTTFPLFVTVEDKGTGLYSEIPSGDLIVTVPSAFSSPECGDRFVCVNNECSNSDDIIMIDRKSPTFRCTFLSPDSNAIHNIDKIFNIEATLNYTYYVTQQVDVQVKSIEGM
jgi:hypothetical protein